MAKKEHWLHKKYDLEGWFHKHLYFKDDSEFAIFLVWALFVSIFFVTLV